MHIILIILLIILLIWLAPMILFGLAALLGFLLKNIAWILGGIVVFGLIIWLTACLDKNDNNKPKTT